MKRFYLILLTASIILIGLNSIAFAATSECQNCHTIPPDFNVQQLLRKANCYTCHASGDHAKYYGQNGIVYYAEVWVTGAGWFKSNTSITSTPEALHNVHAGYNTWASNDYCKRCHQAVSCVKCHDNNVTHQQHGTTKYQPVSFLQATGNIYNTVTNSCAISDCHSKMPKVKIARPDGTELCYNCHTVGKAGHTDAAAKHISTFIPNPSFDCAGCHKTDIASEHAVRTNNIGVSYDCLTCHKNTRLDVKAAIQSNNKNCDACHTGYEHITIHENRTLDNNCQSCHISNLITEHLKNSKTQKLTLTCDTCHKNSNMNIQYAISAKNIDCTACHTTGHNVNLGQNIPADIPLYPGFEWSVPQDAAIWANETWFDIKYQNNSKRVLSNRRTDTTIQQLNDFYSFNMIAKGWSLVSQENLNNTTILNFTYGPKNSKILFYNTELPKGSLVVPTGYRLDIFYK